MQCFPGSMEKGQGRYVFNYIIFKGCCNLLQEIVFTQVGRKFMVSILLSLLSALFRDNNLLMKDEFVRKPFIQDPHLIKKESNMLTQIR